MTDTASRSLVKTLTWRVTGSSSTFAIAYLITGSLGASSGIAVVQMIVNTVLYLIHERAWSRVHWGRR
jgi:uncharacterized membrane protein